MKTPKDNLNRSTKEGKLQLQQNNKNAVQELAEALKNQNVTWETINYINRCCPFVNWEITDEQKMLLSNTMQSWSNMYQWLQNQQNPYYINLEQMAPCLQQAMIQVLNNWQNIMKMNMRMYSWFWWNMMNVMNGMYTWINNWMMNPVYVSYIYPTVP